MGFNINQIVKEWSYRVHDGMPDIKNSLHMVQLRELLREYKITENVIDMLINNLQDFPKKQIINEATKLETFLEKNSDKKTKHTKQLYNIALEDYLSRIPAGMAQEAVKKVISSNPQVFFDNIGKYTALKNISDSDHSSGFAKKMFDLEPKGLGRAEVYIAWVVKDAKISGGGETFDVTVGSNKYEIKDYSKGAKDTIRLGVHGKVTQFPFWRQIQKTVTLITGLDKTALTVVLGDVAKDIFAAMNALDISKIQSGEVSQGNLKNLRNFYVVANAFVDEVGDGYNQMTLKGPNIKPKDYMIKMISDSEIPASGKATIEIVDNAEGKTIIKFMNDLRALDYVRNPDGMWEGIHEAVSKINKAYSSVKFIIFRPGPKMMIQGKHFKKLKFGSLTGAAIKVLEDNISAGWESIEGATVRM